jgi:hypothetical protein
MAARHGLGVARAWAWTLPVTRAGSAPTPIVAHVRSFGTRPLTTPVLSTLRIARTTRMTPISGAGPIITALRIRNNSSNAKPPIESDKESTTTTTNHLPVDPLTAPPIVVAETPKPVPKKDAKADPASIMKLLSLAKPQWPLLTVGIGCLVVSTGVNLGIPWAIGRIIDYFAPGSEATLLFGLPLEQATWALIGILLVGALANSGRAMALRLAGQRTVASIRSAICPLVQG